MKQLNSLLITAFITILLGCSNNQKVKYAEDLSDNEDYEVILMCGQSNMVGQGKQSDLKKMNFENISFFDFGLSPKLKNPKNNFGPEVGLAMELNTYFPNKKFILIKYAIGGASLLDWSPNYSEEEAQITGYPESVNMYQQLLTLTDSLTKGQHVKIIALLWMQGEKDALISEAGINYYQNFELLINSVRNDLHSPNMPVIFGKINPPGNKYPALKTVVDAQIRIGKDLPNVYMINTDHLEKWDDKLHYSSNGQIELGRKFGKKLTEILKN